VLKIDANLSWLSWLLVPFLGCVVVVVVGFLFEGWFWLCFFPPVGVQLGLVLFYFASLIWLVLNLL
jgi:hypothetical protein